MFRPKHTLQSVVAELTAGLLSGEIELGYASNSPLVQGLLHELNQPAWKEHLKRKDGIASKLRAWVTSPDPRFKADSGASELLGRALEIRRSLIRHHSTTEAEPLVADLALRWRDLSSIILSTYDNWMTPPDVPAAIQELGAAIEVLDDPPLAIEIATDLSLRIARIKIWAVECIQRAVSELISSASMFDSIRKLLEREKSSVLAIQSSLFRALVGSARTNAQMSAGAN